jgi:hypothetical protein
VWQTSITSAETTDRQPNEANTKETIPHGTFGTGYPPLNRPKKANPKLIGTDQAMPKVDSHIGPTKTGKVNPDLTVSSLPAGGTPRAKPPLGPDTHPGEPTGITGVWRDGTVKRPDAINVYSDKPFPHEATTEKVRRIKAEIKNEGLQKNLKYVENVWIDKYSKLSDEHTNLKLEHSKIQGLIQELRQGKTDAEAKIDAIRDDYAKQVQDAKVELLDYKGRYGQATRESTKFSKLVEDLNIENNNLKEKYHGALANNLKLTKDLTKANEDYLEIAKQKERVEEALKRAKINSKKTLKIKV